jgi:hypothetical protein
MNQIGSWSSKNLGKSESSHHVMPNKIDAQEFQTLAIGENVPPLSLNTPHSGPILYEIPKILALEPLDPAAAKA